MKSLFGRPSSEAKARTIAAPLSKTVQTAMHASGVVSLLGGVLLGLVWLAETQGPSRGKSPSVPFYSVLISLMIGFGMLRMPEQMQQVREKRLKEYQASASPGAPPPVEVPQWPDVVFLSTLFGLLSLISVPIVFAPAAIGCGIVALTQGHLKGVIGMVLGVASLIVWGLVVLSFFSG